MITNQELFDKQYPLKKRNEIKSIDINGERKPTLEKFSGSLDLNGFVNLETLNVSYKSLKSLDFLKNLNPEKLINLYLNNNEFSVQDLSIFGKFVNLERLSIGGNISISGSLEPLQNLTKLKLLDI